MCEFFLKALIMATLFFLKGFCIFLYIANSLEIVKSKIWGMGAKAGSIYHIFFVKTNAINCSRTHIKKLRHKSQMVLLFGSLLLPGSVRISHLCSPSSQERPHDQVWPMGSEQPCFSHFWTDPFDCWSLILRCPCLPYWLRRPHVPVVKHKGGGISVQLDHWVAPQEGTCPRSHPVLQWVLHECEINLGCVEPWSLGIACSQSIPWPSLTNSIEKLKFKESD